MTLGIFTCGSLDQDLFWVFYELVRTTEPAVVKSLGSSIKKSTNNGHTQRVLGKAAQFCCPK